MARKHNNTPQAKAQRCFNKMVDNHNRDWGRCADCPGVNQCKELGFKGREAYFENLSPENQEKVVAVLGGTLKGVKK